MNFIIVTGMSGSGKSKAIEVLEDLGYFCVDNVPPQLLGKFTDLSQMSNGYSQRMAVVVDARSGSEMGDFNQELKKLREDFFPFKLVFLDTSDSVLLNRYKEKRRRHPLLSGEIITLEAAIQKEREILSQVRNQADCIIDTSHLSPSQLQQQITDIASQGTANSLLVQCMSFGFKYGIPMEADLVWDVRCLRNPFYVEELRERTGLEEDVRDYIFEAEESRMLRAKLFDLIDFLYPLYVREGKTRLVIAIGCTGGKHRSVAFAQAIADHLKEQGIPVLVNHRDKDKPNSRG